MENNPVRPVDDVKLKLSRTSDIFLKTAAIIAGVTALAGGYAFFLNYVWKPKVVVENADFVNGKATLKIGTIFIKVIDITGDTIYQIAGDWGVRFGTSIQPNGQRYFDRIEVLKRNLVHKVLKNKDEVHSFTGSEEGIVSGVWGVPKSAGFDVFKDKSFTGNEETFWDDAFFGDKGSFGANVTAK